MINCLIYVWAPHSPLDIPNFSFSVRRRRWRIPVMEERNLAPPMRRRIARAASTIAPNAAQGDLRARACHHHRLRVLCWASTPIRFRTTISRGEFTLPLLKASPSELGWKGVSPFSLYSLASAAGNCFLHPSNVFQLCFAGFFIRLVISGSWFLFWLLCYVLLTLVAIKCYLSHWIELGYICSSETWIIWCNL